MDDTTTIDYSIRLIGLSSDLADEIKNTCNTTDFSFRKYYKDKEKFVVTVPIVQGLSGELLDFLVPLESEKKDIFVSISSESDSDIVDVPNYITDFMIKSKLPLTLSYTVA